MHPRITPAITCRWPVQESVCGETAHMTMIGPLLIHFECRAGHAFHTPLDCVGLQPCDCAPPVDILDEWWLKVA
jgi:hypothetical protein